ncbi:MAG: polysaccharide deacetylase family protein [Thermoproteota archaeon]
MKLAHLGAISTGIVIVLGVALIAPAFLHNDSDANPGVSVMISFDVLDSNDAKATSSWCSDLASVIDRHQIKATLFLSGKTAEASPECVTSFSSDVDIGSRTYSYVDLTAIDYRIALDEVWNGKVAIDEAGRMNSKLFKAPYGSTDENIYSLLSRSGILADFSYRDQYNKYQSDRFVKYNLTSLAGDQNGQEQFFALVSDPSGITSPVAVNFDSSMQMEQIDEFVSKLRSVQNGRIHIVNASDLTGMNLTIREESP